MSALLEIAVEHRLGAFTLSCAFTSQGRLTALFGPSGAGKTSLINAISGSIRPDEARIVVDGQVMVDTKAGMFLPRHRRRIGYVFQEARLFPHLTVRQNLLFGRWFAPRAARARPEFDQVVALLGIGALLERYPAALSGGEKQRIAIGRALLADPRLLLMDEPLASLDGARKAELLAYIERLRDEFAIPIVYVSHAMAEVARLAQEIVLIESGRVVAYGPTGAVLSRPDLGPVPLEEAGAVLEARVEAQDEVFALTRLATPAGPLLVPRLDLPQGTATRIRVLASDVLLSREPPPRMSALNRLDGVVAEIGTHESGRSTVEVKLACGEAAILARITRRSLEELDLRPGLPVHVLVKSVALDRSFGG